MIGEACHAHFLKFLAQMISERKPETNYEARYLDSLNTLLILKFLFMLLVLNAQYPIIPGILP